MNNLGKSILCFGRCLSAQELWWQCTTSTRGQGIQVSMEGIFGGLGTRIGKTQWRSAFHGSIFNGKQTLFTGTIYELNKTELWHALVL